MLAEWTKILPFFIVQYLARHICEKTTLGFQTQEYAIAYKGVYIRKSPTQGQERRST